MSALQTSLSASLVVVLVTSTAAADAAPEEPARATSEVATDEPRSTDLVAPATPPPTDGEQRRTGRFVIGAGYVTDDGVIAHAGVAQDDLFGTGTRLALGMTISERQQRALVRFEVPSLLGSALGLRADLYRDRKQFPGFTRDAVGGALTVTRSLAPNLHAFGGYRLEQVMTEPDGAVAARGVMDARPSALGTRLGAVRAGLEYSTLDDPGVPTRGTRVGGMVEIADRRLGSDVDLFRAEAALAHHRPLGPFTLHLGGSVTAVSGNVPLSERLHFDGSSDVRGLLPGALGPTDVRTGMSLGGDLKATARGELELPLIPRLGLSLVGFVDVGAIYAPGFGETGMSAGVGLLWRSPIGPLRFDVAFPRGGEGPAFLLNVGSVF